MSARIDWDRIRLVVFDLDGTLYHQRPLRLGMAADLARHSLRERSVRDFALIRRYRQERERLAEEGSSGFVARLEQQLADRSGLSADQVGHLLTDWMERRPLARLPAARIRGADALFRALQNSGRQIGVWSDYPVADKLESLGLVADHVCSAVDADVGRLKPDPRGLLKMLSLAGVEPRAALMVGDRVERDGEAARRAGVPFLLRSHKPAAGHLNVANYEDPLFAPLHTC